MLSDERPNAYLRHIERLEEKDFASTMEGITITWSDIECVLISKFCDVKFTKIYECPVQRGKLVIEIDSKTTDIIIERLKEFIISLKLFFVIVEIRKVNND